MFYKTKILKLVSDGHFFEPDDFTKLVPTL